jgi:hypothetical protein
MAHTPKPRFVDGGELAALVRAGSNAAVLAYLAAHQPSAHSDLGDAMLRAARAHCGEWLAFSPSFGQCRYVALVTNETVFALARGMRSACYRLPAEPFRVALESGASAAGELGPEWVAFELFRPDRPAPDLAFWTLAAYGAARAGT